MLRALAPAVFAAGILGVGSAAEATCTSFPYNLANGSPADATQVMGDFNGIVSCPLFTGNMGIGTTSPGATNVLTVASTDNSFGKTVLIENTNTGGNAQAALQLTQGAYTGYLFEQSGNMYVWNAANGPIVFDTNSAGQMIILGNGDVGIGTNNPTATLYVQGTTFSTTGWSSTSDGRLKKDVEPISNALATVAKLQGVRFHWLQPGARTVGKTMVLPVAVPQIGFVAQDVEKVVPEAVTKPASGSDGVYSMDATKLIPLLVESIKEQQAEIKEQRAEIDSLETKVARLDDKSRPRDKHE